MAKKYPKSDAIQDAKAVDSEAYVTWGDDLASKQNALKASSGCLDEYGLFRTSAGFRNRSNDYSNLLPGGIHGKPGLTRRGYDYFRPDEAVPTEIKLIIRRADDVYQRVGLVKNVIDLMGACVIQIFSFENNASTPCMFCKAWHLSDDAGTTRICTMQVI